MSGSYGDYSQGWGSYGNGYDYKEPSNEGYPSSAYTNNGTDPGSQFTPPPAYSQHAPYSPSQPLVYEPSPAPQHLQPSTDSQGLGYGYPSSADQQSYYQQSGFVAPPRPLSQQSHQSHHSQFLRSVPSTPSSQQVSPSPYLHPEGYEATKTGQQLPYGQQPHQGYEYGQGQNQQLPSNPIAVWHPQQTLDYGAGSHHTLNTSANNPTNQWDQYSLAGSQTGQYPPPSMQTDARSGSASDYYNPVDSSQGSDESRGILSTAAAALAGGAVGYYMGHGGFGSSSGGHPNLRRDVQFGSGNRWGIPVYEKTGFYKGDKSAPGWHDVWPVFVNTQEEWKAVSEWDGYRAQTCGGGCSYAVHLPVQKHMCSKSQEHIRRNLLGITILQDQRYNKGLKINTGGWDHVIDGKNPAVDTTQNLNPGAQDMLYLQLTQETPVDSGWGFNERRKVGNQNQDVREANRKLRKDQDDLLRRLTKPLY